MTVDEYERLVNVGALDDPRIELIDGYLVKKMSKKPPHIWSANAVVAALSAMLTGRWCRKEDPVRIPEFDEPEPDASVVRGSMDNYRNRIPGPDDVLLLAEVSETTLDRDRGEKRRAYARGKIPFYWIVNLIDRQIEVYSGPTDGDYGTVQIFRPGDEIPVVIDGVEVGRIAVASILP